MGKSTMQCKNRNKKSTTLTSLGPQLSFLFFPIVLFTNKILLQLLTATVMPMSGDDRGCQGWRRPAGINGIEMQVCYLFTTMSWVVLKTGPYHISTGTKYMCRPGPFNNGPHSRPHQMGVAQQHSVLEYEQPSTMYRMVLIIIKMLLKTMDSGAQRNAGNYCIARQQKEMLNFAVDTATSLIHLIDLLFL